MGVNIVNVYVEDFPSGHKFYADVLGLQKEHDIGEKGCYFKIGDNFGLILEGGNERREIHEKMVRTSFIFVVESVQSLFDKLKSYNIETIQDKPLDVGNNEYWFQFRDPAGNILEAVGGK
jgi:predicted enzyme related to lactoylglutathione lyase